MIRSGLPYKLIFNLFLRIFLNNFLQNRFMITERYWFSVINILRNKL